MSRHDDGNVQLGHLQYLPLSPVLFALLAGIYLAVVALIQVGILRYAYLRLGIAPEAVLVLLLGSLLGSYFVTAQVAGVCHALDTRVGA